MAFSFPAVAADLNLFPSEPVYCASFQNRTSLSKDWLLSRMGKTRSMNPSLHSPASPPLPTSKTIVVRTRYRRFSAKSGKRLRISSCLKKYANCYCHRYNSRKKEQDFRAGSRMNHSEAQTMTVAVITAESRNDIEVAPIAIALHTKITQPHSTRQIPLFDLFQAFAIRGDAFGDQLAAAPARVSPTR